MGENFSHQVHPWKLTWNLKITQLKRKIIFPTSIFGFHVSFRGCKWVSWNGSRMMFEQNFKGIFGSTKKNPSGCGIIRYCKIKGSNRSIIDECFAILAVHFAGVNPKVKIYLLSSALGFTAWTKQRKQQQQQQQQQQQHIWHAKSSVHTHSWWLKYG